jgi:hypothetical protein
MKRTFATAVAVVMAGSSIWLAAAPAYAKPEPPKPQPQDTATIRVVPKWTYRGDKIEITTKCSARKDLRVVSSKMLSHTVNLRGNGNLLIHVSDKTKPGKYSFTLWCVTKKGQVDSLDVKWTKIYTRLRGWKQPAPPRLLRHFKADVTVQSGPAAVVKTSHRDKKAKKVQHHGH